MGKKRLKYLKKVYSGVVETEELTELNLPGDQREAENVVGAVSFVNVRKREAERGRITVSGMIGGTALYSDEQRENEAFRFTQGFELSARSEEIPENAECTAEVEIVRSELKRINPQKLLIRTVLNAKIEAYQEESVQLCPDLPEGEKTHCKTKSAEVLIPAEIRYKPFNVSDSHEIPQDVDEDAKSLYTTAEFCIDEVSLISRKALIKGEVRLSAVLKSGGEIRALPWSLPFSQLVELEEAEENGDCRINVRVRDVTAELTDGKIEVNVAAETGVLLFKNEAFDYVEDVYSNAYNMDAEYGALSAVKQIGRRDAVIPVETTVEPPFGTGAVYDAGVRIAEVVCEKLNGEMQATIAMDLRLLCGGEDGNHLISKRVSASAPANCDAGFCFSMACAGEPSVTMNAEGILEIRFEVRFEYQLYQTEEIHFVSSAELKKDCPTSSENMPSAVLKRISGETDIWTLAKQYHTTEERIRAVNGLAAETASVGKCMLLIPKE